MPYRAALLSLFLHFFFLKATARSENIPFFTCNDPEGTIYQIKIGTGPNTLEIIEKGKKHEIALSGANASRKVHDAGRPLVYSGWNESGSDLYSLLDLSTEVSVQYVLREGETAVKLGIIVDHREKNDLKCQATGFAAPILMASDPPAYLRFADLIAVSSGVRTTDGTLQPIGILGIEEGVRRMYFSPEFPKKDLVTAFIKKVSGAINKVDPRSVNLIRDRLTKPLDGFWKSIVEGTGYNYFPAATRYSLWVKDGMRSGPDRDLPSVASGFNEFVKTKSFEVKDLVGFFNSEVTPSLRSLTENDAEEVRARLEPAAQSFFSQIWTKAVGKRTIADIPDLADAVKALKAQSEGKKFDPQKISDKLVAFLSSPAAADPEVRKIFIQTVSPVMKGLTARQKEDVAGWLEKDSEKQFFQELLKK